MDDAWYFHVIQSRLFRFLAICLANIKQSSIYFKEHASASLPGRIYLASRRFKSVDHRSAKFCPWIVLARRNKDSQDTFSCDRTQ